MYIKVVRYELSPNRFARMGKTVWQPASTAAPRDPAPGVHALMVPLTLKGPWIASRILWKWQWLLSLGHKRHCGFHLPPTGGTSGHIVRTGKQPMERPSWGETEAQTAEGMGCLDVDLPAPVQPSDDCSPCQHPHCSFRRQLTTPEPPS